MVNRKAVPAGIKNLICNEAGSGGRYLGSSRMAGVDSGDLVIPDRSWRRPFVRIVPGRGFTMIELLVVIAVLAILFALIFPQAQKMVDKGNAAKCMGNLRQLYLVTKTYEAEMGVPLYEMGNPKSSGSFGDWVSTLYVQLNMTSPGEGKRPPGIFGCPSSKGVEDGTGYHWASDYGKNSITQPDGTQITSYMWRGRILPNPSKVMLFGEFFNQDAPTIASGRGLSPFRDGASLGYRHGGDPIKKTGRANVIFYDGHGETAGYDGAVIPHAYMTNPPPGYWYTKPPWEPGT